MQRRKLSILVGIFGLFMTPSVFSADDVTPAPLEFKQEDGSGTPRYPTTVKIDHTYAAADNSVTISAGGSGAPTDADYLVGTANGSLSAEIVVGTSALSLVNLGSKLIGGSATTADLFLQTTSGVGAAGADMHFLVGNNGATEAMTILNNGFVGIGTTDPQDGLHVAEDVLVTSTNCFAGKDTTGSIGCMVRAASDNYTQIIPLKSGVGTKIMNFAEDTALVTVADGGGATVNTYVSQDGDAADAGYLRLANAATIAWEASPAGTDVTLSVDASELFQFSTGVTTAGDLTVTGGDITLGTTSIFSGGDTASLNNVDAIDATTETTLEAALDIAGDVSSTGMSTTVIGNDKVLEAHLKAVDAAVDEECLTFETTTGDFEWQACGSGTGDITDIYNCASGDCASIAMADGDLLDGSAVSVTTTTEGIILPQHATACTSATAEGQVCWEADADNLWVGDGAAAKQMNAGGTDTNADKEYVWPMPALLPLEAADSIPPLAKDAGTNLDQLVVDFDQSTDECRTVAFLAPPDITSGGTVTFTVAWYAASVTTNNVCWDFRHNSGVAEGVDPDAALTTEAATCDAVQGTAGQITVTTWTETQTNLAWAASDVVEGVICRDADNASDNFAADARAIVFGIRIPRS